MSEDCCSSPRLVSLRDDDEEWLRGMLYWCSHCGALVSYFHGAKSLQRPRGALSDPSQSAPPN